MHRTLHLDSCSYPFLSAETCRSFDHYLFNTVGLSLPILMEVAGLSLATLFQRCCPNSDTEHPLFIFCGSGNNGGDGLVAARYLHQHLSHVHIIIPEQKTLSSHATQLLNMCHSLQIPVHHSIPTHLYTSWHAIDCLLGFGISGPVHTPYSDWIPTINTDASYILSCDLPSGMNPDTGVSLSDCIRPHTVLILSALKYYIKKIDRSNISMYFTDLGTHHFLQAFLNQYDYRNMFKTMDFVELI